MPSFRTTSDKIFLFIKGLSMGAANKVPGVSGGIVAFVAGFYEELIYSLQKFNRKALILLFNGRFRSLYQYINGTFLILIFAGSTFSYFSVSIILDYFLRQYELIVWSTFFGMILGSIYYISKDFKDWSKRNIIVGAFGILMGISISLMNPAKENDNLWFVFFCGIIGVSGMTLPGLSGSFILILLGNYVLLLVDSVNELFLTIRDVFSWNFEFMHNEERIRYLKIIASFTLGSVFGLVTTSHIIAYLLKKWHQKVTAVIIGFIAGSLGIVWPWKQAIYKMVDGAPALDVNGDKVLLNYQRYFPDLSIQSTWIAIFFILFGTAILVTLEIYGKKKPSLD